MTMSDRIAVFNHGRIEQLGVPEDIYERPQTSFVADFLGAANVLSGKVVSLEAGRVRVRLEDAVDVELPANGLKADVGAAIKVAIRPERIAVRYRVESETLSGGVRLKGDLVENVYVGNACQIFLKPFGESGKSLLSVSMEAQHRAKREPGSAVWADIKAADILLLHG